MGSVTHVAKPKRRCLWLILRVRQHVGAECFKDEWLTMMRNQNATSAPDTIFKHLRTIVLKKLLYRVFVFTF